MGQETPDADEVRGRPPRSWVLALALGLCATAATAQAGSPRKDGRSVSSDAALLERIRAVDPVHADTMSRQPTTFTAEPLPFYRRFKLVRAAVSLPHRPLEFRYADDGEKAVPLTGKPEDVYRVNEAEGLALAEAQVADYVRFFVGHTRGDEEREVAERPADLQWLPGTETDADLKAARARASGLLKPLAVSSAGGGYRVTATVVEGRKLSELVLAVDVHGRVDVESARVLVPDLPVPETL
jgi:hypothetical protein